MDRPHDHHDLELNFVDGGQLEYLFGANRIPIAEEQVAAFWGAAPHRLVQVDDGAQLTRLTVPLLHILSWNLPSSLMTRLLGGSPVMGDIAGRPSAARAMASWLADVDSDFEERLSIALLEIEAHLRCLALCLASAPVTLAEGNGELHRPARAAQHIAQLISERYREPLRVADLAAEVHLHPSHAMMVFRQTFGVTIMDDLTRYRVSVAQRLLAMTNESVLAVGMEAGFGSSSRYYAAFRDICGQSPRQYRLSLRATSAGRFS